jgi:hypothetical protein
MKSQKEVIKNAKSKKEDRQKSSKKETHEKKMLLLLNAKAKHQIFQIF